MLGQYWSDYVKICKTVTVEKLYLGRDGVYFENVR